MHDGGDCGLDCGSGGVHPLGAIPPDGHAGGAKISIEILGAGGRSGGPAGGSTVGRGWKQGLDGGHDVRECDQMLGVIAVLVDEHEVGRQQRGDQGINGSI